jgi:hypothetical protein
MMEVIEWLESADGQRWSQRHHSWLPLGVMLKENAMEDGWYDDCVATREEAAVGGPGESE